MERKSDRRIDPAQMRQLFAEGLGADIPWEHYQIVYAYQRSWRGDYRDLLLAFRCAEAALLVLELDTKLVYTIAKQDLWRVWESATRKYTFVFRKLCAPKIFYVPFSPDHPMLFRCVQFEAAEAFSQFCKELGA